MNGGDEEMMLEGAADMAAAPEAEGSLRGRHQAVQ